MDMFFLKQETLLAKMEEKDFQLNDVLDNPLIGDLMNKFLAKKETG